MEGASAAGQADGCTGTVGGHYSNHVRGTNLTGFCATEVTKRC